MNTFIALEATAAAMALEEGHEFLLEEGPFRELYSRLQNEIRTFSREHVLEKSVRKALYAKLPELRRWPIVTRIVEVVESAGVNWQRLWPGEPSLEPPLRQAYARRSALAHSAVSSDWKPMVEDYNRVHALTEQLIFAALGGKDEWQDISAYEHLR